ncbi:putative sensor domain DACNV-containing protein [Herpetosiphon giganteus]|uniref:putative sensor domain DACNV-containing protein n=1 Tax=Herpetosiphon giganteus TaxID=2029754 RepID=UPI00195C2DC3|nr:diadenylate cyclase [Herpetosiphon giganteus]MBM7846744.1 hypothetical protein [Herpetosiphon giganteus]
MSKHYFPSDLANFVHNRWENLISGEYSPPNCPSKKILEKILEVSYLASLEMDEGRALTFSICCTPLSELVKRQNSEELVETWEFEVDRELVVSELRRLAPVASTESTSIWITYSDVPDSQVSIHGLVNQGSSWAIARRGRAYRYDSPPSALIVNILGYGRLSVYQGQYKVATLSSGQLIRAQTEDMISNQLVGVHKFLKEGTNLLRESIETPIYEHPKEWYGFEWICYINVLVSIVNVIQQMNHGGTLVISGNNNTESDLKKLFKIKYKISSKNILSQRYVDYMNIRHKINDIMTVEEFYSDQKTEYSDISDSEKHIIDLSLANSERLLGESTTLIGNLAGTDGAIILNTSLEVIGFGAEIISSHEYSNKIYTSKDWFAGKKERFNIEQFGMRHRSAIRLCASTDNVFAFVISQDGDITLIWRDNKSIMIKRNIDITNANMVLG